VASPHAALVFFRILIMSDCHHVGCSMASPHAQLTDAVCDSLCVVYNFLAPMRYIMMIHDRVQSDR